MWVKFKIEAVMQRRLNLKHLNIMSENTYKFSYLNLLWLFVWVKQYSQQRGTSDETAVSLQTSQDNDKTKNHLTNKQRAI